MLNTAYQGDSPSEQMLPECLAIAHYALTAGKTVSPAMMERLSAVETALGLLASGVTIPEGPAFEKMPGTRAECAEALSLIHSHLCQVIAPAKPRTVLALKDQSERVSRFKFLGPLSITRRMMGVAIYCLLYFLVVSLNPSVNGDPKNLDFHLSDGADLLANILWLLSAAGMGSSFAALFQLNKFVKAGTYDPKYDASYWNRFLLGVMAGLIMAFFIPVGNNESYSGMSKALLALLGGFSSSAVYRILNRIIASLETVFKGDPSQEISVEREQVLNQANRQKSLTQMDVAGKLNGLRALMGEADPEAKARLEDIQRELLGGERASLELKMAESKEAESKGAESEGGGTEAESAKPEKPAEPGESA